MEEAAEYILSNWTAAKLRLKHKNGVMGSSTESHVSHILSARMSSRPMGWSRQGAAKMAELRAYYFNGGDMLELVRYQKKTGIEAAEKEEKILSSTQILRSERNRHGELGNIWRASSTAWPCRIKRKCIFRRRLADCENSFRSRGGNLRKENHCTERRNVVKYKKQPAVSVCKNIYGSFRPVKPEGKVTLSNILLRMEMYIELDYNISSKKFLEVHIVL